MRRAMGGRGLTFLALLLIVTLVLISSTLTTHPVVSAASPETATTGGGGGGTSTATSTGSTSPPKVSSSQENNHSASVDSQDHGNESNQSMNGGGDEGVTGSDGTVRDVSLVIKYQTVYGKDIPKPESASCMTSDLHHDLNPSVVPNDTDVVSSTDATDTVKQVTWSRLSESSVLGVTCSAGGNQAVIGPIIHPQATLIRQRLSITLNKDEDLRLPLLTSPPGKLLWQKEPWQDSAWKEGTLINHNELFIPSHQLNGSGIYKIIKESARPVTSSTPGSEKYNVFSLLVRECPEHRYGLHCLEWCPDCLNGGMCDARDGECVCPPGVMGRRCQTVCPKDHIGRNCTVNIGSFHQRHVVCVGAPLGCTCAPGFHGERCDTRCSRGKWGANCAQTCPECCDSRSGGDCSTWYCTGWEQCKKGRTPKMMCGEGELGLPRLRQMPNVTPTSDSATVSFKEWQQEYDDGLPPNSSPLTYAVKYWPDEDTKKVQRKPMQTRTTFSLDGLSPATTYHLQVLVRVGVGEYTCDTETTGRGRVHTVTFNTTCPDHPPKPEGLSVDAGTSSLVVKWQPMDYLDKCGFWRLLNVTPSTPGKEGKTLNTTNKTQKKINDLEANTEYTVTLQTCSPTECSAPASITDRTDPGELVVDGTLQDGTAHFSWGPASGSAENLQYQTYHRITSNGPGNTVLNYPVWSDPTSERNKNITVSPYSTITLWVVVKIDGGESPLYSTTIIVPPSEPGKVRNLDVGANVTSLVVTWDEPGDDPPKGKLESFRVNCSAEGTSTQHKVAVGSANERQKIISDLKPDTKYIITVEAKNEKEAKYGEAATTTTTTTLGVPSVVGDLKADETMTSLNLTWQEPKPFTGVIALYNASLFHNGVNKTMHVTDTSAKFEGLTSAQMYQVEVTACNRKHCGNTTQLECWTEPGEPQVKGGVSQVAGTDTTITIRLPLLTNPPGRHLVTMQKDGGQPLTEDGEKKLMEAALSLVKKEEEQQTRDRRSAVQEPAGASLMFIAATVVQEGQEQKEVTVGGTTEEDDNHNPLENGVTYVIIVVTEKRNGQHVKRHPSVPQRFVARSFATPTDALKLILGLAGGAVVIAVVLAIVFVGLRKRRGKLATKLKNDNDSNSGIQESVLYREELPLAVLPATEEDIYMNISYQVLKKNLEAYLLRAVMSRETKIEFDNVPLFMSTNHAESVRPENCSKNRYRNKVIYDDTRVILPPYNDIPHSDYINASYVEGPTQPAAFIATQGPKDETVGAFWRMMWHSNCNKILMVANLKEGQKVKVAQYWPEDKPWRTEGITVTPVDINVKMDFVIRSFTMSNGNTTRKITQYQYTAWPDHGVPKISYGLAQMINLILRDKHSGGPLTVHCSAGIGRTGTVILVLYLLDQLEAFGAASPSEALMALRRGRGRLVENTEQYIFAHQVLHEVLFSLETSFLCHAFEDQLPALRSPQPPDGLSALRRQHEKLKTLPKDLSFKYGKDPECAHLNRDQDILPYDKRMVFVQGQGYGVDSQYINVVRINGVDQKDAYLAGEHPQSHTLGKMWRLVYERKVPVWVLVHTFPANHPDFPDVTCVTSTLPGNMTLKASPKRSFLNYYEQEVDISVTELGKVIRHQCLLLHLKGWPATACLPASPEPVLLAMEKAEALSSQNHPPLFTCKDGVTGCGVVAALMLAVSRAKLLQEVDIYRSVASIQQDRPQFIVNLEQYDFLHTALAIYLSNNNHYGNFN